MTRLVACSAIVLGLVVGLPYYGMPFFYDYFERAYRWSRADVTLGLPLATLITLIAGPYLVPRLAPRTSLLAGTLAAALAFLGMSYAGGSRSLYYAFWILYMLGWTVAGPLVHQVILTRRILRARGSALALGSLGVSFFGAMSVRAFLGPVTAAYGFETALRTLACAVLCALPFAILMVRDDPEATRPANHQSQSTNQPAIRTRTFWLLLCGSTCTIGALGAISQHLKLIFQEAGYAPQALLDRIYGETILIMLVIGAVGRLSFGWLADRYPKRHVLTAAFLLIAIAAPLLLRLTPPGIPILFAILFGFGMGIDFLLTPVLAAEHFGTSAMPRVMGVILPVNTIGQTWFPYGVSLLRETTGSYWIPLCTVFAFALLGRLLMAMLPAAPPYPPTRS